MIITCPACGTRYDLPENAIGDEGRTLRCANCRHSWFEQRPSAPRPADSREEPAPAEATAEAAVPAERPADPPEPVPPSVADPAPEPTVAHAEADASSFAFEPPVQPRRSRTRAWLLALLLFALAAIGIGAAIAHFGPPDWLPGARAVPGRTHAGLVLDFPRDRIERRTLPDGTEFFGARGTITNVGHVRREVPPVEIVLRDRDRRIVYRWDVIPPKRHLAPGESVTINQAVTDIPRSAIASEIGWKAG